MDYNEIKKRYYINYEIRDIKMDEEWIIEKINGSEDITGYNYYKKYVKYNIKIIVSNYGKILIYTDRIYGEIKMEPIINYIDCNSKINSNEFTLICLGILLISGLELKNYNKIVQDKIFNNLVDIIKNKRL